jgi:hypothetical protein
MAKKLIEHATKNGSQDNISVLIIRFWFTTKKLNVLKFIKKIFIYIF